MKQTTVRKLRALAVPPSLLCKADSVAAAIERYGLNERRILNVGSKDVRFGETCINLDIAPGPGVDVIGDAHDLSLHFAPESFDAVVLSAVLQYCGKPANVLEQVHSVLKPGGLIVVDAPFLQPYCPDGPDLWRFTEDGLRHLCGTRFEILELKPSIAAGPALGFFAQAIASHRKTKVGAATLGWLAFFTLYPLRLLPSFGGRTAGAFLLVGRKIG